MLLRQIPQPLLCKQVSHGFVERRILVAEAVGHLAHVVDPDIANSLLLSVVQQLAEDAEPGVRAAAAASLGLLAPALTGHDKYLLVRRPRRCHAGRHGCSELAVPQGITRCEACCPAL